MKKNTKKAYLPHDDGTLTYNLRRSKKAKNIILTVDISGEVELVVPWHTSYSQAQQFARQKIDWIKNAINKNQNRKEQQPRLIITDGAMLPILGDVRRLTINLDPKRKRTRYKESKDFIEVYVSSSSETKQVLERWYKTKALNYFKKRIQNYEIQIGVKIQTIVVSNANSQWGSCMKEKRRISLHWRLAKAPLGVVDYVIAHEIAHMKTRGHNQSFWRLVEEICPEYKHHKKWLRENIHRLYW